MTQRRKHILSRAALGLVLPAATVGAHLKTSRCVGEPQRAFNALHTLELAQSRQLSTAQRAAAPPPPLPRSQGIAQTTSTVMDPP